MQRGGLQRLTSAHHVRHHTADNCEKVKSNHYINIIEKKAQVNLSNTKTIVKAKNKEK